MVDSGASMHIVSRTDFDNAELKTVRMSRNPTTVVTANDEVRTKEEVTENVKELDSYVRVMVPEDTPAVLSLGNLCQELGYSNPWNSGQKPYLIKHGRKIECNTADCVPFFVPGLSTSSSTSSSPNSRTSSSQDTVITTEYLATERSESMSESGRRSPSHGPAETENPNANEDDEELQSGELQGVPDWLQEFKHGLVDESVPEHRDASSSSQELLLEPQAKVVSGKCLEPTRKPKVFYTDNSLEFGKGPVKIFLVSLYVKTTQIRNKMGLQKEQCAEIRTGHLWSFCSPVWVTNGGRIPWNATAICETFKISCLLGRHLMKGGSEDHLTNQLSRLEQWSNITLFLLKTYRDDINLVQKSCQV